jgi:hypothetical protein
MHINPLSTRACSPSQPLSASAAEQRTSFNVNDLLQRIRKSSGTTTEAVHIYYERVICNTALFGVEVAVGLSASYAYAVSATTPGAYVCPDPDPQAGTNCSPT